MAAFRLRRRMILWSLLVGFLVGLGLILNAWLPPQPRCIIPMSAGDVRIDFLSDDGDRILTTRFSVQLEPAGPMQTWDTHFSQNLGTYFAVDLIPTSAISSDGRFLAALQGDLYLVNLKQQQKEPKNILQFSGDSMELTFSSQGHFLAVRCKENPTGHLVECSTGRVVKSFQKLTFFRFLPDENVLVVDDGKFTLWNPSKRQTIHTFKNVDPLNLSPDGRTLLAQSVDKGLFLLDLRTQESQPLEPAVTFSQTPPQSLFSPDGKTMITFPDLAINFWDVPSGKQRQAAEGIEAPRPITELKAGGIFSSDSAYYLLTGLEELSLWESSSGRPIWKKAWEEPVIFDVNLGFRDAIRFTGNSKYLIVPKMNEIEILEVQTGETRNTIPQAVMAFGAGVPMFPEEFRILITKDARLFSFRKYVDKQLPGFLQNLFGDWWPGSTNEDDVSLKVVETATGRIVSQLQGPYGNGHLSNDGRTMVTGYREPDGKLSLRCWDLPLRPPLRLVAGIPLGIGLLFVLASWWRGRRGVKRLPA